MPTHAYVPHAPGYVDNDGPKIVTSRFPHEDSYTLARAEATGAYDGLRAALTRTPAAVHEEVREATVLGRGGAGFPAGVKWGFMPPGKFPYYLVVNGDESEPGTYKDRLLMERDPHQLIEGCLVACYALGLAQCFLYVRGEMALAQERIAQALNDAYAKGYVGKNILGTEFSVDITLTWGAGAYIVGEETTLIESLEGNRGMPRLKPPYFPAAIGLYGQPTIVNNVETLANLPWLMNNGAAQYKTYGSESSPGTRMIAVSGHVKRPGVYEVEQGVTTFRDLLYGDNFCQGIRDGHELKMFVPGGGSAPWFFPEQVDLPLEARPVGEAGSMLGSGAIIVMDETTDAVKAALRLVRFYARESCGKCTPCREGTTWEERVLQRILDGEGRPSDIDMLLDIADNISPGPYPVAADPSQGLDAVPFPPKQTTICPLGPSSVAPITSTIRRFRDEYEAKITKRDTIPVMSAALEHDRVTDTRENLSTVTVTVNGTEIQADPDELLIDACERTGTYIPRFCHHSRMNPVGMCRMCLVEVDTGRGPALQPSCMLPVSDGMTVETESEVTKKAQDGVLEFLLINHPLDCPVCDKGGECPLQDQTMAYGPGESRFIEEKRHYEKPLPISDTVYLDRERCILCDRCTRFADEVAGDALIHFMDRGNNTQVNTFPDEPFASYFSGNTVQICPVGALTAKPYRFKARPWDLEETISTAWTDSVGSRITVQSSRNKVLRVLGVDADAVNWGWLSDKERFAFEAINSEGRLDQPLVRVNSDLEPTGWAAALTGAVNTLQGVDPNRVAVLGGSRLTNESQYAWAKLMKGVVGTDHVDAHLGDGLPPEAVLGLPRATIDDACRPGGTIILVGPDPKEELGALFLRLRHAVVEDGATLIELTPHRGGLSPVAAHSLHPRPGELGELASALVAATSGPAVDAAGIDAAHVAAAAASIEGPVTVVLGRASLAESSDTVVTAALALAQLDDVSFLSALRRGNVHGALDNGLVPGLLPGRTTLAAGADRFASSWPGVPAEKGLDAAGILRAAAEGAIDVLVLLGADPINDFPDIDVAAIGLQRVGHVIAVDMLPNDSIRRYADVVLAAAAPTESSGTFTNLEGRVSVCEQKVTPVGTSRPDWMIAAEIAMRLDADMGFDSPASIRAELASVSAVHAALTEEALEQARVEGVLVEGAGDLGAPAAPAGNGPARDAYSLRLVATRRMYDDGVALRHSPASVGLARAIQVRLNPVDFDRLGVDAGAVVKVESARGHLLAPVAVDAGVPAGAAAIPFSVDGWTANQLIDCGAPFTDVRVERP